MYSSMCIVGEEYGNYWAQKSIAIKRIIEDKNRGEDGRDETLARYSYHG